MELSGKLEYISIFDPIRLISENGELDFSVYISLITETFGERFKVKTFYRDQIRMY
jgi:hypothetical protein